eukprot:scaffold252857_cov42-Attheya_sp.AAC.1
MIIIKTALDPRRLDRRHGTPSLPPQNRHQQLDLEKGAAVQEKEEGQPAIPPAVNQSRNRRQCLARRLRLRLTLRLPTAKPLPQKPVTPRRYHCVQPKPRNPFTVADGTTHKPKATKTTGASGGGDSGRVRSAKSKNKRGRHHATFAKHVPHDQWRLELCVMAAEDKGAQILEKMNATHMKHQAKRIE